MALTDFQTSPITLIDDDGLKRTLVLANDASGNRGWCDCRLFDEASGLVGKVKFRIDTGGHIGVSIEGDPSNISLV